MPIEVVFETHELSGDNERGIATGELPGRLSAVGRCDAAEIGRWRPGRWRRGDGHHRGVHLGPAPRRRDGADHPGHQMSRIRSGPRPGLGPAADGAGSSRRGEAPMCPRRFSCDGGLTTARAALQFEGVATRRDGTRNGVEVTWAATQARLIRRCRHRAGPTARRRPLMGPSGWMRTPRGCPLVVMAREAVHPSRQRRKRHGRLKVVSHLQSQCPTSHSARWTSSCRSARGAGNYREPAIPPAAADRRTR